MARRSLSVINLWFNSSKCVMVLNSLKFIATEIPGGVKHALHASEVAESDQGIRQSRQCSQNK